MTDTMIVLPQDTQEAATRLLELFESKGGFGTREEWAALSPADKERQLAEIEAKRATTPDFRWIAEMADSDYGWSQMRIDTNWGVVYYLRFLNSDPGDEPALMIFYPNAEQQLEHGVQFYGYRKEAGWQQRPLQEALDEYNKFWVDHF